MRILFLTPQVPYRPDKGTTIRNLNLIKRVARHHEVDLLSFASSPDEEEGAAVLRDFCGRVEVVRAPKRATASRMLTTFFSPWPDMALRLYAPAYAERLATLLAAQDYDILQVEGIELMRYALELGLAGRKGPAVVFDDHNAEYVLQRRAFETDVRLAKKWPGALYSLIQWQKLKGFERRVCRAARGVLAVSEGDRQALRQLDPRLPVVVVPNGVDSAYFAGYEAATRSAADREPSLVFVGTMEYRPNVDAMTWFCGDILPLIEQQIPEVTLQIIGRHPAAVVRELASAKVAVRDDVADVRPELAKSAVYVVPMRIGGGVRFKVLEAMACRVPVVTTSMGADGIPAEPNRYFYVADEPAAFAEAVVKLLRQPEAAAAMTEAGQRFVREEFEWEVIVPRLEALYDNL